MAEVKKAAATTENKRKMVTIKLPRDKKEPDKYVSINNETWLIKRGEPVEVPECVAKLLELEEIANEERYAFEQATQK